MFVEPVTCAWTGLRAASFLLHLTEAPSCILNADATEPRHASGWSGLGRRNQKINSTTNLGEVSRPAATELRVKRFRSPPTSPERRRDSSLDEGTPKLGDIRKTSRAPPKKRWLARLRVADLATEIREQAASCLPLLNIPSTTSAMARIPWCSLASQAAETCEIVSSRAGPVFQLRSRHAGSPDAFSASRRLFWPSWAYPDTDCRVGPR